MKIRSPLNILGRITLGIIKSVIPVIEFIGECITNLLSAFNYLLKGKVNFKHTLQQAALIGYDSVGISLVIIFITGAVISLQVARYFYMSGGEAYVGGLVSLTILKELAPVFTAMVISARAGTAMASELGNMKITQQVDAMKTLNVDPVKYLVLPRVLASSIVVPMVTVLAIVVGLLGGMYIAKLSIGLHQARFMNSVWLYTHAKDIYECLLKSVIFGIALSTVCATRGLKTTGGAREVGVAVTKAAIWTTVVILILDYLITWLLK
ncbi:MAG: ABC transporter permease [Candidatus Gastranaerophilales bacterium]|nr:ABC transporter permease [Candidatus Gastranaerophilales bacterium]